MKVLIVAAYNKGYFAPFITDQANALTKQGVIIEYLGIRGKGIIGYLKNRRILVKKIKTFTPDIIHAHYGLSGLLANLQRKIPVVVTYHGSDINNNKVFLFSKIAIRLSAFNIFVSEKNRDKAKQTNKCELIPCGVDTELFIPLDKMLARKQLGLDKTEKLVLFAGAFDNAVKNPELAKKAVSLLKSVTLLELKGYTRKQVALLMNAVDVCLMTSFTEGSPQFIKEAMSCNCPVVSVPVGDVENLIGRTKGCFISTYEPNSIVSYLQESLNFKGRTHGRERIVELGLDAQTVAEKIKEIYEEVIGD
ncbi:MAG: glycosyltransferase [Paludibacter sp.]|nr:glycosyltransferase [Paludibacter sp.]